MLIQNILWFTLRNDKLIEQIDLFLKLVIPWAEKTHQKSKHKSNNKPKVALINN